LLYFKGNPFLYMHYLFDGAAVSSSLTNFLFGFFS
jgi:hypothetical protein